MCIFHRSFLHEQVDIVYSESSEVVVRTVKVHEEAAEGNVDFSAHY